MVPRQEWPHHCAHACSSREGADPGVLEDGLKDTGQLRGHQRGQEQWPSSGLGGWGLVGLSAEALRPGETGLLGKTMVVLLEWCGWGQACHLVAAPELNEPQDTSLLRQGLWVAWPGCRATGRTPADAQGLLRWRKMGPENGGPGTPRGNVAFRRSPSNRSKRSRLPPVITQSAGTTLGA